MQHLIPTIALLFAVFALISLAAVAVICALMIITVLLFLSVFIVGGALSVLSAAYSFSSLITGNFYAFFCEIGIFFIILSLTLFLSYFTTNITKKLLPSLSVIVVRICTRSYTAIKRFFAKCKKGCATL